MRISTLAIANRGEVAVRIIRACQEMGIRTLLLHSEPDINSRAYRMADHRICIGSAPTNESYLNIAANIRGALAGQAQAIHPGFGFLSENADFAEACAKAGLIFVGPSASSIRKLGDKVSAKALAKSIGLPMVPGYEGENQDVSYLVQMAEKIGFPVIVKAAAGGGGRGMKILTSKEVAFDLIESAQREALSAFGSQNVFLEKYLGHAKHIEFQIFADCTGRVVHLFERECSVQRRHQKIVEEALSPSLTPEQRKKMGEASCALAEAGRYQGAGTVEFLFQDGEFYFLEMNTRLQVEHPVTELVAGFDLVKAQIRTAQGEAVFDDRDLMIPRGHSIECRLYAEDPYAGGVPSTGRLGHVIWPEGPGRRFDYGFEEGDRITPYYDSMIAKAIVWDTNRSSAIEKMLRVLSEIVIFGVRTNIPLLKKILSHPEFVNGTMTTQFMGTHFPESLQATQLNEEQLDVLKLLVRQTPKSQTSQESASSIDTSVFSQFWRNV